jgi:myo-inositol-1(or 4)-monophosphatase
MRDDLDVAIAAVRAAAAAAQAARARPLRPRAKSVSADLVTEADAEAEAAAAAVLRERRPEDGMLGEEGTRREGAGRRWLIDGVDGTVSFANRLSGGWCSAIALEDERGAAVAAVLDPGADELHAAARGGGGPSPRSPRPTWRPSCARTGSCCPASAPPRTRCSTPPA